MIEIQTNQESILKTSKLTNVIVNNFRDLLLELRIETNKRHEVIHRYIHNGMKIGLKSEKAIAQWVYLELITEGKIVENEACKELIQSQSLSLDRDIEEIVKEITTILKTINIGLGS